MGYMGFGAIWSFSHPLWVLGTILWWWGRGRVCDLNPTCDMYHEDAKGQSWLCPLWFSISSSATWTWSSVVLKVWPMETQGCQGYLWDQNYVSKNIMVSLTVLPKVTFALMMKTVAPQQWHQYLCRILFCFSFWGRVLLCSSGLPRTYDPLASGSWVLELQLCTTTPSFWSPSLPICTCGEQTNMQIKFHLRMF
jgi:hypothetical protein